MEYPPATRRRKRHPLEHSLDVLTDGSEYTGHGTVFLTVSKRSSSTTADEPSSSDNTVLARYALAGVSSMTARLCADQKLTLRQVRAVTCPTFHCCDGLASLLLHLTQAGAASLTVCGSVGTASYTETVASIVLKHRAYPQIATCEVPVSETQQQWWKIYSDEFIVVHGANVVVNGNRNEAQHFSDSSICLIYTLLTEEQKDETDYQEVFSFCVLPPGCNSCATVLRPLPNGVQTPLGFALCVDPLKQPHDVSDALTNHVLYSLPQNDTGWDSGLLIRAAYQAKRLHRADPSRFPVTDVPAEIDDSNRKLFDSSLLKVGGKLQGLCRLESCTSWVLEKLSCTSEPFRLVNRKFRIRDKCERRQADFDTPMDSFTSSIERNSSHRISNCEDENEIDLTEDSACGEDQVSLGNGKATNNKNDATSQETCRDNNAPTLAPQLLVLGTGCASPSPLRGSSGFALFLPSLKESGEHHSFVPDLEMSIVIECGEGFLTSLSRYMPCFGGEPQEPGTRNLYKHLLQIRFIWISHSHLDHYGGLPCLIRAIQKARLEFCSCGGATKECEGTTARATKRRRLRGYGESSSCQCFTPPVVVAPLKVLQFLDASLGCKDGRFFGKKKVVEVTSKLERPNGEDFVRLYLGVNHQEFESSPFAQSARNLVYQFTLHRWRVSGGPCTVDNVEAYRPCSLIRSVPVEHCPQAHALLLSLNCPARFHQGHGLPYFRQDVPVDNSPSGNNKNHPTFLLCYSGDTRPSPTLVTAYQEIRASYSGKSVVSLLIHESTFSDDERGIKEARQKRHSTVSEALGIARETNVDACLLTHFSQRYPRLPPTPAAPDTTRKVNYAFAIDGLLLSLCPSTLSSLCVPK